MATEKVQLQDEPEYIPSDSVEAELEEVEGVEDYERGSRRRGGAFDTLARILRGITEMRFVNDFIIKNRPRLGGSAVKIKNMFEAYYQRPSDDGINAIIIGRKGDGRFRNNHLIELAAKHSTPMSNDQGFNNGIIKLRITRDDEDPDTDNVGLTVADAGTLSKDVDGVAVRSVGTGEFGGVLLSWIENRGDNPNPASTQPGPKAPRAIIIQDDCIRIVGLPTSSSGLPSGALYRDGTTLRIVA